MHQIRGNVDLYLGRSPKRGRICRNHNKAFTKYKGHGKTEFAALVRAQQVASHEGDNGHSQPNYSDFLGNLEAAGIACSYRPAKNRNAEFVFQAAGTGVAESALLNVFQEFVSRKLTPKLSRHNTSKP
jgi:hypothetical protein